MFKNRLFIVSILWSLGLVIFLVSCKKEYVKTPFDNIEEFSVKDSVGNVIKAAITNDSIRVYWAPFQTVPQNITPQIALSSGATISPASGVAVPFKTNTPYTVTAQDGSKKTYYLKVMVNQPVPVFQTNGTDFQLGTSIYLSGQYFVTDTSQTKVYLVNTNNKSIQVPILTTDYDFSNTAINVGLPIDGTIDTGYYKIKLLSGVNTITSASGPVHIGKPAFPTVTSSNAGTNVNRGQNITLNFSGAAAKYYYTSLVNGQAIVTAAGGRFTTTIQQNDGILTIPIPITATLGKITLIQLNNSAGVFQAWYRPGTASLITIIE